MKSFIYTYIVGSIFLIWSINSFANSPTNELPVKDSTPKPWKIGGIGNVAFSQGYLSNWVQGGENSISTLWSLNLFAKYKYKRIQYDNTISWKYGLHKPGEQSFRKNEDLINANTKFGYQSNSDWYYSAMIGFKSQFFNGFNYPNDSVVISSLMAPAYLQASIGMDYKLNSKLSVLLSPVSARTTIIADTSLVDQTKYGVAPDKLHKQELGAFIKTIWKLEINDHFYIQNTLELFTNYLNKPQNIDVDWEMNITLKATKYITTNISTHLIYDDDIRIPKYELVDGVKTQVGYTKKIQFKELLSVGLSYKF
jgi:hypothetical protein